MSNEIVKVDPAEFGLEETKAREIEAAFTPMLSKMSELEAEYNEVVAKAAEGIDSEVVVAAKTLRLKYVKVRTGTAAIHKQQKAYFLSAGRCVDGWKNAQLHASHGIEENLSSIEKHFENMEKERLEKLQQARADALVELGIDFIPENLADMADDVWEKYFAQTKQDYLQRKEAEHRAEQERIAREKAEAEERERIRLENERLKKEAEERERLEAERRAKEEAKRKAFEERHRQQQAKLQAEREERERLEREKAEREARERAEREAKAKAEADAAHCLEVEGNIMEAITTHEALREEVSAKALRNIIEIIASGDIPHLAINY